VLTRTAAEELGRALGPKSKARGAAEGAAAGAEAAGTETEEAA